MKTSEHYVIRNRDADGNLLRPSNWIERLASNAGEFAGGRVKYDGRALPCKRCDDLACLMVDVSIGNDKPHVLQHIESFMELNKLPNHASCCPRVALETVETVGFEAVVVAEEVIVAPAQTAAQAAA